MATYSSILAGIIPWTEEPGEQRIRVSTRANVSMPQLNKSVKYIKIMLYAMFIPKFIRKVQ